MIGDKRLSKRQPLRYTAWVALTPERRHGCVVSDVSETGARIDLQDAMTLPDHFVLMLTSNGSARRFCRVMWRKPTQVGVQFTRTMAEAAAPSVTPAPDADAQAAPAKAAAELAGEPDKTV